MFVLRLHCDDKPGIVAAVATTLSNCGCNIEESSQFHDPHSNQFFMRVIFTPLESGSGQSFTENFESIAAKFAMKWQVTRLDVPLKTLILVSKASHCLNDILYRWRTKSLNIEITGVVSNHETNRALAEDRGIPYHYLNGNSKVENEARIKEIADETGSELLVLARYMQIMSPEMCEQYHGRMINIHHSFLPGFKGAKPYHQAYERGVKITGATAHFATNDLDEGPIIEQGIMRVDHSFDPKKMQIAGRDTEAKVLARAIELFSERRIFLHGNRTVIL